ncbi:MAG: PEP-CTERM sorting domain-containing protein [Isosphaeraceae bacterium]
MRTGRLAPALALALVIGPSAWGRRAEADLIAHLVLNSQPGDFIGQGKSFDITYTAPGTQTVSAQIRRTVAGGAPGELLFVLDQNVQGTNTFALLFFGTDQLGIPMQPGVYGLPGNTAQRADFAAPGHAGLDVSFQNRGSNTVTGNFTVTEATFYQDAGNVTRIGRFAATFEQHSEGATPALFGSFTFQDTSLAAVPEPSTLALAAVGISAALGRAWLKRRRAA